MAYLEEIAGKEGYYTLKISGQGKMKDWTYSSKAPWYSSYRNKIQSVTIENGVTTIGNYAFYHCISLTSVKIPESVTSMGDSAFDTCESLASIVIQDSVTAIGNSVFDYCTSLTISCEAASKPSGWYSYWNTSNLPVFWGICNYGTTENGLDWILTKDNSVIITGYIGNDSSVSIPAKIDGYILTTIGEKAFYNCDSLTSIEIPNGVTTISYSAFANCTSLISVVIPDSVTKIDDYAFCNCKALPSIVIGEGVITIGDYVFSYCESLTSIVIPKNVLNIGYDTFENCNSLTIYCEATKKPIEWEPSWNPSNLPVVWGYKE